MINTSMKNYNFFLYGDDNGYGQPALSEEPKGTVKMSINITNQAIQDNIQYKDATYLGLTHADVTDKYVIEYGDELLKVLYVNPLGKYNQVFMSNL